ncbi:MAG: hypothetical protein H6574_04270 [Lewinellaceae bacterium]|nr:hypothetical protein [Saprospiraceae bacterium]MCB9330277.1 hypothetical protein [Lewinellaceae bacterium]
MIDFLRKAFFSLVILTVLPGAAGLDAQTVTPDIIVAADGTGDFTKIQAAIDAAPDNSNDPTIIYLKRGTYDTEKLIVPANKTNLVFIGESREETIISYHIYDCTGSGFNGKCPAAEAMLWSGDNIVTSATLTILGDGFKAENLTILNTAGPVGQAQAITVRADRVIFRNCTLSSYQDTMYFWSLAKRSYFENCLIIGRTDYIYGSGTVFFQQCEIRSWGGGWITAPSTALTQPHGFVFNQCAVTYALNSPRPGDDGALVALGRPWHDYPKVAWLFCDMTEKINPLGWPDKWNMPYADTSPDLHLYEYMNTGPGADMSGRANWVGIRALTPAEANNYTVQAVLSGNDGWDPTAEPPLVKTYHWTGGGGDSDWLTPENWDPVGSPDSSEAAFVRGTYSISADGGQFAADLTLSDGANLEVTAPSQFTLLAIGDAGIDGQGMTSLSGRIRTRDSLWLASDGQLDLFTEIIGVHDIRKTGTGTVQLMTGSPNFAGFWTVAAGTLAAAAANALGEARGVTVANQATLRIDSPDAYFVETPLFVEQGGHLALNADITLSEFYLNGIIQPVGEYTADNLPDVIIGPGKALVGRPDTFEFVGGANGNWDNPDHFVPALLPEPGETVLTKIEMETTAFVFPANIVVQAPGGRIRLRGVHSATGMIFLENGTSLGYATSGTGFALDAPIHVLGNIQLNLNSRAVPDHFMRLGGLISGNGKVTVNNQRTDTENNGIVELSGDNSAFSGRWDLTVQPANPNSVSIIQGTAANALGHGIVDVGVGNRLALAHEKCAGDTLRVNLTGNGRIRLETTIQVQQAVINNAALPNGTYTATTHPDWFEGVGMLVVGASTATSEPETATYIYAANNRLYVKGAKTCVSVFNTQGRTVIFNNKSNEISLEVLPRGIYVAQFDVDGHRGVLQVVR